MMIRYHLFASVLFILVVTSIHAQRGSEATQTIASQRWETFDTTRGVSLVLTVHESSRRKISGELFVWNRTGKSLRIFAPGLHVQLQARPLVKDGAITTFLGMPLPQRIAGEGSKGDWVTLESDECFGRHFSLELGGRGELNVLGFYSTGDGRDQKHLAVKSSVLVVE